MHHVVIFERFHINTSDYRAASTIKGITQIILSIVTEHAAENDGELVFAEYFKIARISI